MVFAYPFDMPLFYIPRLGVCLLWFGLVGFWDARFDLTVWFHLPWAPRMLGRMQVCYRIILWYGLVPLMEPLVEHLALLGLPVSCVPRDPWSYLTWFRHLLAVWTLQAFQPC